MYDYLIYNQLKKYKKAEKSFHVPGHKGKGELKKLFPVADVDVTELGYSDNLFCPSGVIAKAQEEIAEILGAKRSFILTDGSTCGVLSMMYVLSKRGKKVIVPRNCHQSVWNACRLFGVEPLILGGQFEKGVCLPPTPKQVQTLLENDGEIAGMLALSPDYYGNIAPLKEYSTVLKRYNKLLFVDEAHGAHIAFERENGAYAGLYADMWVDGAHKSLPTLTQGAVISVNREELIADLEEALAIFRTTSPSYPVMASVEYGIKYCANNRRQAERAKEAVSEFKKNATGLEFYPSADWTKLVWDLKPLGINSDRAYSALENCGIYAELSDGRHIIFYLSPQTSAEELKALLVEIRDIIGDEGLVNSYVERAALPQNERACGYLAALNGEREYVALSKAAGRICAANVGITPPCIPVIVGGELYSQETVNLLLNAKSTFGAVCGKVAVVKK